MEGIKLNTKTTHRHEQGDQDQDHGDGARVGDGRRDQHPQHTVEDAQERSSGYQLDH